MNSDLTYHIKTYMERSLAYELRRHYNLRGYASVRLHLSVYQKPNFKPNSMVLTNEMETVIETTIREYWFTDPKDSFIMKLRDQNDIMLFLRECADRSTRGLISRIRYYRETEGLEPHETLEKLSSFIP